MTWRESLWPRFVKLHEQFDAIETGLSTLPVKAEANSFRTRFHKANDALAEARGAYSHGEWALISWLRIGPLERRAREMASELRLHSKNQDASIDAKD